MDCAVNTYVIVLQGWFSLYIKVYFGRLWAGRPVFLFKHLLSWLSDLAKKNRFIFFFFAEDLADAEGREEICVHVKVLFSYQASPGIFQVSSAHS